MGSMSPEKLTDSGTSTISGLIWSETQLVRSSITQIQKPPMFRVILFILRRFEGDCLIDGSNPVDIIVVGQENVKREAGAFRTGKLNVI